MNQDKLHLVNQLFQNETIRTVWDKESERAYRGRDRRRRQAEDAGG